MYHSIHSLIIESITQKMVHSEKIVFYRKRGLSYMQISSLLSLETVEIQNTESIQHYTVCAVSTVVDLKNLFLKF